MPEVIITYKHKRALEALRDFAKYLDYKIIEEGIQPPSNIVHIGSVPVILANKNRNPKKLKGFFTGRNITLTAIRNYVWNKSLY
jgi:hypothetical protein